MTPDELEKAVKKATSQAIEDKLGSLFVSREQHYKDHEFITSVRKWTEDIRSSFIQTIVKAGVLAIIALIILGFVFWGKNHFK